MKSQNSEPPHFRAESCTLTLKIKDPYPKTTNAGSSITIEKCRRPSITELLRDEEPETADRVGNQTTTNLVRA